MPESTEVLTSPPVAKVRQLRDVPYLSGTASSARHRLDLYLPAASKAPFPILVSAPGGGLVEGDKANDAAIGQRLAAAGIGVAILNYRLSPEVRHPGHVEDLAAAVAWVHRSVGAHGGDPQRLFVAGHSAGAYLAALLVTDLRYLRAQGLRLEHIRGLLAVSGFYWVERVAPLREKHIWGDAETAWLDASPARYLHDQLPPALFVYADGDDDDRRAQNIELARAARAAGNQHAEALQIAGRDHRGLWTHVADAEDPLARRILEFVGVRST